MYSSFAVLTKVFRQNNDWQPKMSVFLRKDGSKETLK